MIVAPNTGFQSFISLSAANIFHTLRGNTAWLSNQDDDAKEGALVRASDFIKLSYKFTVDPVANSAVNEAVADATALLALLALSEELFAANPSRDVLETEQKLDGVGSERTKFSGAKNADRFPMITAMLSDVASFKSSGVHIGTMVR